MKKIVLAFLGTFLSCNLFAQVTVVKLPVIYKVNGWEKNSIVHIENNEEGIVFINRTGYKEIVLSKNTLEYYTYAYTNGPETGRQMRSFNLNSEKTKQDILKYSGLSSLSCPFVIWKAVNGELSSYEIPDCMPH